MNKMNIHKFGGASIKNAEAIKQMVSICQDNISNGVIVVSAMGKTTNLLEKITDRFFSGLSTADLFNQLIEFNNAILAELFPTPNEIFQDINRITDTILFWLGRKPGLNFDFEYDQIVSFGELISTKIIAAYLNNCGYKVHFVDIRNSLKTDSTYREGKVNWELTSEMVKQDFNLCDSRVYLTQGFIGMDINNLTTTLGREGSDYTAAILANILDASKVIVWKDVPGILCADPKWMPNSEKLNRISYQEAIELTYYGAKVIHPKTIKPLQNKQIPLQVKSFLHPKSEGTIIEQTGVLQLPSVFIRKEEQVLITIKPLDFSFIVESNLSHIFGVFAQHQIKVNVMQNSAISFSVAVDGEIDRVKAAIRELKKQFDVKYNDNLQLLSIRHTKPQAEQLVLNNKEILLEQRSRSMVRFVLRNKTND